MIHLDTSFLVDLLRESARGRPSRAFALIDALESEQLAASVHVVCELRSGAELSARPDIEHGRVDELCQAFTIVYPSDEFPRVYAQLLAALERSGSRIGVMDLLIATGAVIDKAPLVTRNSKEFSRVPGLSLVEY